MTVCLVVLVSIVVHGIAVTPAMRLLDRHRRLRDRDWIELVLPNRCNGASLLATIYPGTLAAPKIGTARDNGRLHRAINAAKGTIAGDAQIAEPSAMLTRTAGTWGGAERVNGPSARGSSRASPADPLVRVRQT